MNSDPATITGVSGSSAEDTTAGNIARPADSPNALAVGAVCSAQEIVGEIYPPMFDSSHGPIFRGWRLRPRIHRREPPNGRDFKPDLVAPSHVYQPSAGQATFDCDGFFEPSGGFNGTSASAAHVAGMAALLLSNGSMSTARFRARANPAIALQNYLQTHTVDLTAAAADGFSGNAGFDQVYGAGLSVLGNPQYDLSQVDNPLSGSGGSNVQYVGLANPDSAQSGTPDNPYIHPAAAIAAASPGDRIVFMPGEYTSGLGIIGKSDLTLESLGKLAVFWVNDSYEGQAGIHIEGSTNIAFDGFTFQQADPFVPDSSGGAPIYDFVTNPDRHPVLQSDTGQLQRQRDPQHATFKNFTDREPAIIDGAFGVTCRQQHLRGHRHLKCQA